MSYLVLRSVKRNIEYLIMAFDLNSAQIDHTRSRIEYKCIYNSSDIYNITGHYQDYTIYSEYFFRRERFENASEMISKYPEIAM